MEKAPPGLGGPRVVLSLHVYLAPFQVAVQWQQAPRRGPRRWRRPAAGIHCCPSPKCRRPGAAAACGVCGSATRARAAAEDSSSRGGTHLAQGQCGIRKAGEARDRRQTGHLSQLCSVLVVAVACQRGKEGRGGGFIRRGLVRQEGEATPRWQESGRAGRHAPSCPSVLLPQPKRRPSSSRKRVWSRPQRTCRTQRPSRPVMGSPHAAGRGEPHCPCVLLPNARTTPSAMSTT